MEKLVLYFDTGNRMVEYILPAFDDRQGMINLAQETGVPFFYITYEVWDGSWILKSNEYIRLSQNHIILNEKRLTAGDIIKGKVFQSSTRFTISVRILDLDASTFTKYDIRGRQQILVGQDEHCDICLKDQYVSHEHLAFQNEGGGRWSVTNRGRNGSYLNQERIEGKVYLKPMDCITILGFKFYFLANSLAANSSKKMSTTLSQLDIKTVSNRQVYEDQSSFSKSPRLIEPMDEEAIEIEQVPSKSKRKKTPLLFILGPSLTMPIPILSMVLFNVAVNSGNGSNPLSYIGMVISVCMFAVLGIGWSIMRNKYDEQTSKESEAQRIFAYRKYIKQNEEDLAKRQRHNRHVIARNYSSTQEIMQTFKRDSSVIWNRNVNHSDFLFVRVGTGSINNPNPIHVPKERFSVDQDSLAQLPQKLYKDYSLLAPVAKLADLRKNKIIGVIGDAYRLQKVINNLILQIAMLHSYTDVGIALLEQNLSESYQLEWIKWLPHTLTEDRNMRLISDNESSKHNILYYLTQILRKRKAALSGNSSHLRPMKHYLVFSTHQSIIENENIYQYMVDDLDYQFTFILLYGQSDKLPNECKFILGYTDKYHGLYQLDQNFSDNNKIRFEKIENVEAEDFARQISGLHITETNESAIPDRVDYFELLGIGKIEQWNLLRHYKENRSYEGINALIGVGPNERPIYLDIHEKKHGPHGLVAGTTGAGKSELIQTFILSLALNYQPDEVAFILIDYKGGGMANAFLGMPHVAGTITNLGNSTGDDGGDEALDENQTRRALISIRSEIKRRQRIFNQYQVSHIDAYMRLYRNAKAEEPVPHLIIISDEFAELKKERPEFIKELVSTARVGRSLGIHLILATQKPGGVVDEEIWANSRFKLCLRVQDKQDSIGMLKRPEASELTQTGRAYMQIGNDEVFEQFQSAYSGASYIPKEDSNYWDDDAVSMINLDGSQAVVKVRRYSENDQIPSQLETAIKYIQTVTTQAQIGHIKPLWLPALPKALYLNDLERHYTKDTKNKFLATIGLVDYPEEQQQYPLTIDFLNSNNILIVGRAGCGKTTLLQTMALSLMRHYSAEQVQFYCADFSSRSFKIFEKMPHFGGVAFSDETEKVARLIQLLEEIANERKKTFSGLGIGNFSEYIKIHSDLPLIIVMIDNYFEFNELFENLDERFQKLLRIGTQYGVQFVVTMSHINDMRYKIKQNFGRMIPMLMNEKGDYMEALGCTPPILPTQITGRGLVRDKSIAEYQTALPVHGENEMERREKLEGMFNKVGKRYKGITAKPIPVIPSEEPYSHFIEKNKAALAEEFLPIGYYKEDISLFGLPLRNTYCHAISAANLESIEKMLNHIITALRIGEDEIHLIHLNAEMNNLRLMDVEKKYANYDDIRNLLLYLRGVFKERSDAWKAFQKEHPNATLFDFCNQRYQKIFVLIDDMERFEKVIYQTPNKESMNAIFELFLKEGKSRGVYFISGFPANMPAASYYMATAKIFTDYNSSTHWGGQLDQQRLIKTSLSLKKQMVRLPGNEGHVAMGGIVKEVWQPDKD